MKSVELLALLIKLTTILLVLGLLRATVGVIPLFSGAYGEDSQLFTTGLLSLGIIAIGFALSFIFWNFPVSVAKWFLPRSNDEGYPNIDLELESLEIVLYSAIGIYLIALNLPNLAYDILYFVLLTDTDMGIFSRNRGTGESALEIFYSAGSIVIGVFLAFFSGNVKKTLQYFKASA